MDKKQFTIARGGLLDSASTSRKEFISAYVTNTRLMGVIGMYIHFALPDNRNRADLHQFFYFDCEEFGFESYDSLLGADSAQVQSLEASLIGALGGQKIPITLREAQYLLKEYVDFNKARQIPLPDNFAEYGFLLQNPPVLSEPEHYILMKKQCISPSSPYETINYFLMRCFGKDFAAAAFLTKPGVEIELFSDFKMGTFCKNTIDRGDETDSYINESLVEFDGEYYLVITHVKVSGMLITAYERISSFRITAMEAAMMLSRSEFVSVYQVLPGAQPFTRKTTPRTRDAMVTVHESGTLYMLFHINNQHVARQEYRLNEDVFGMYFVSNAGQIICASYSLEEIKALDMDLITSTFNSYLLPLGEYEFQEPVLYEFIQSGFDDFNDFVDAIKIGD